MMSGILKGVTVLELAGLAPAQFCGQILSDYGARVIRIDKVGPLLPHEECLGNGKLSVALNLKTQKGIETFKRLSSKADVIVEPYRAGVMEKLGLGPDDLLNVNKRLIYTRLSGYGQTGPYSNFAGHDINFLSLSGVLSLLGWRNKSPYPPCNIIGDFGGGSLLCAMGVVAALYEREKSGLGQVVDLSIMRGSSYLAAWIFGTKPILWSKPRGENLLDGGSYLYDVYETKDGKWMALAALEKKFYDNALIGFNLTSEECPYFCESGREILKKKFKEKTQKEWIEMFANLDACVTPVLSVEEAAEERPEDFVESYGERVTVPRPEPRFSRSESVASASAPPPSPGQHTFTVLKEMGYTSQQIESLAEENVVAFQPVAKL